jgi:outer membrane protein assembly factor BamB
MSAVSRAPGPIRLWPGVAIVALQWLLWLGVPTVATGALGDTAVLVGVMGGLVCGLLLAVWWAFFSRAPRVERWAALALVVTGLVLTSRLVDPSIGTAGMGVMLFAYAVPVLSPFFVAWVAASRRLSSSGPRLAWLVATLVVACGGWTMLRSTGMTGDGRLDFTWRWTPTPEERLLAEAALEPLPVTPAARPTDEPVTGDSAAARVTAVEPEVRPAPGGPGPEAGAVPASASEPDTEPEPEWPGFRGPRRDGIARGVTIATDWSQSPPVELWRRPVGPAVSSFAVNGGLLYTQEQRGDDEIVAAYRVSTGEPVWAHREAVRFWDSHAGAGPRGTPTLHGGRVYAVGGTGRLTALDADTGGLVWSRDAAPDRGAPIPGWGFSSSPVVVGDVVIIALSGMFAAYDADTGEPRWTGPRGGDSYSSPHLVTIDGEPQVLLMSASGVIGVEPETGVVLWEHAWPVSARILQPVVAGEDLLVSADGMAGVRRIGLTHGPDGWTTTERWTSNRLKPYFNDVVVHEGHAYGFDGSILACIDLENGERAWKGGRYGHGQLLLLADQDVLLVLSEEGELALVGATPDGFSELARVPALDGKTWNHPVLVGDILLVRNSNEMAAFRLAPAR